MAEDPKLLETVVKSLLISTSTVLSANTLEREFKLSEGYPFPFRALGFSSFVEYLRSIPHVVKLSTSYASNPEVRATASADSKHITDLIVRSRKSKPKNARGGGSFHRNEPVRKQPAPSSSGYLRSSQPSYSSTSYRGRTTASLNSNSRPVTASSNSKPSSTSTESYSRPATASNNSNSRSATASTDSYSRPATASNNSYSKPAIASTNPYARPEPVSAVPDSHRTPSYSSPPDTVEDPRELLYELVCQVAQYPNGMRIQDLEYNLIRFHLQNSKIHFTDLINQAIKKNMIYQEGSYIYPKPDEYSNNSYTNSYNNNNYDKSESNVLDESTEDDYYDDYDEEWENMSEEVLRKMTIEHFSQEPCQSTHQMTERSCDTNEDAKRESSPSSTHANDDEEYTFSKRMIANFRTILGKNPDGFWLSELALKYFEEFKVPLDYADLGFPSAILMVEQLPEVFYVEREKPFGDWMLFDARGKRYLPPQKLQVKTPGQTSVANYIPNSILVNIKDLAEYHHNGFRSTELQQRYETHYRKTLDWKSMGFKQLDDFMNALENTVTLKRVNDYYFILPKHYKKPHPSNKELSKPLQALTLERDSFLRLAPENVLTSPNDMIPNQELPQLKQKKLWSDVLLETEVRISEVVNPHNFYFILCSEYDNLQVLMDDLDKFYKHEGDTFCIPPALVVPDLFVACLFDGFWHRAKTKFCCGVNHVEIEYIDYGTVAKVEISELRFLLSDFATFPVQAFHAQLLNIYPPQNPKKWPKESCHRFLELVNNKRLFAQIYDIDWDEVQEQRVYLMILYDTENPLNEIIINETLAEEGFAMSHEEFIKQENEDCLSFDQSLKEKEFADPLQEFSINKTPLVTDSVTRSTLKPPPGFGPEDGSKERFTPTSSSFSHTTILNHSSFPNQTQSSQSQFGIWDWNPSNTPNPLTNNMPNVPSMPTIRPRSNPYMAYSNSQNPTLPTQPNIYQAQAYSFLNQNQAQFNLILNSNNLPLTVPNYGTNVSNNFFLQQNHMVRPPSSQIPFIPDYSIPIPYPTPPPVVAQQAYLPEQQLRIQHALTNSFVNENAAELSSYTHRQPVCREMTTSQLLNNVPIRPLTPHSVPAKTTHPQSKIVVSNSCENIASRPSLKESSEPTVWTTNPVKSANDPSQTMVSSNKNISPHSSIEDNSSVASNPTKSVFKKSKVHKPSLDIMQEVRDLQKMIQQSQVNNTLTEIYSNSPSTQSSSINSDKASAQIYSDEPSTTKTKDENITFKPETTKECEKVVEIIRPEPALSPASCEVKSVFKNNKRSREGRKSSFSMQSSEETAPAGALERRLSLTNSSEKLSSSSEVHGRLSSLSLLSSTTDDAYASCSEEMNSAAAPGADVETVASPVNQPKLDSTEDPDKRNNHESQPETSQSEASGPPILFVEYKDLNFHIINVNNRLAVLANEFYPQFTKQPHYVCAKLMESSDREFHVITKATNADLFIKIEKLEFHPSVPKDTVTKQGKSQISYLTEISNILSILGCENKYLSLLKKLKEFQASPTI